MNRQRCYSYMCGFLALLSSMLNLSACYHNSWGRWKSSSVSSFCLPLAPPLGCAGNGEREILQERDANFWFLPLLASILSGCSAYIVIMDPETVRKLCAVHVGTHVLSLVMAFLFSSAISNVISVIIGGFRIRIVTMVHKYHPVFTAGGMVPTYSVSTYLSVAAGIISLGGCCALCQIVMSNEEEDEKGKKFSSTTKQHLSRNAMYPNDVDDHKMVTFSSMSPDMEEIAAEVCVQCVRKYPFEEDCAEQIKKSFEKRFGKIWHCVVGVQFGSCVEHRTNEYVEVCLPETSILLYRIEVPEENIEEAAF